MSEEHDAFTEPGSSEPRGKFVGPDKVLSLVCVLWLLNSAIGARLALREKLPAEWIAGLYNGRDVSAEFLKGGGTALLARTPHDGHASDLHDSTILSTRGGRAGMAGSVGLTLLGAVGTIGMLAETITYRVLSPSTFDPPKAAIVLANSVLAPLMSILGWRRMRAVRSGC